MSVSRDLSNVGICREVEVDIEPGEDIAFREHDKIGLEI